MARPGEKNGELELLLRALCALETPEEAWALLRDLCTPPRQPR